MTDDAPDDRTGTETETAAAAELARLGEAYFAAQHGYDPYNATLLGLDEFDGLSFDPSREASERTARQLAAIGRQVREIDTAALTGAERVDFGVLTALVEGARADAEHSLWAANASAQGYVSRQGLIFQAVPAMTVASPASAERYLSRLSKIGATLEALGQRYLTEAADGRVPTAVGVDHSLRQLEGYLALPVAEDVLLKPVRDAQPAVADAAIAQLTQTIRPAMRRLAELLRRELGPLARPEDLVGIRGIPGGEAGYLAAVARHTTSTLSPEEIHAIGLAELDELAGLWSRIGRETLGESDFAVIAARLRGDAALRFGTRGEIIAVAKDALDRAEAARDAYFEHYGIPACALEEINPLDSGNTAMGYYRPPAVDGSRPGAFCLVATNPGERFRYEYEALAFHESVPGHHLQLATAPRTPSGRGSTCADSTTRCSATEPYRSPCSMRRSGAGPPPSHERDSDPGWPAAFWPYRRWTFGPAWPAIAGAMLAGMDYAQRPMLVFWETTRACLLACQHCRASATSAPPAGELTTAAGYQLIDQVAGFGRPYPILVLTGGDCLLRPDIFDLTEYAASLGIPVCLSPSVTPLLDAQMIARIAGSSVKAVSISLDGASAATHDGVRGIPGHFTATVAAIRDLVAAGVTVQVNTVVMTRNADELADLAALVADTGAHMWEVFFLVEVGRGQAVGAISAAEHDDVCNFLFDASRYGFVVRTVEAPFFRRTVLLRKGGGPPPDSALYTRLAGRLRELLGPPPRQPSAHTAATRDGKGLMFISSTGDVYPAGFLPIGLGNVSRESLRDIYTGSPLLRDIRAARFVGRCGYCEHADLCGGSRARAYAASGDPLGEDPACAYQPRTGDRREAAVR